MASNGGEGNAAGAALLLAGSGCKRSPALCSILIELCKLTATAQDV